MESGEGRERKRKLSAASILPHGPESTLAPHSRNAPAWSKRPQFIAGFGRREVGTAAPWIQGGG